MKLLHAEAEDPALLLFSLGPKLHNPPGTFLTPMVDVVDPGPLVQDEPFDFGLADDDKIG